MRAFSPSRLVPWLKYLQRAIGAAFITAVAAVAFSLTPYEMAWEEEFGLTTLFRLRGVREAPSQVVVVAIDSVAARALGLPDHPSGWQRSLHAQLIDALSDAGARVIAFDLSFANPSRDPFEDKTLAASLARANNVILLDLLERSDVADGALILEHRLTPTPLLAAAAVAHAPFPLPKLGPVRSYWQYVGPVLDMPTMPLLVAQRFDEAGLKRTGGSGGSGGSENGGSTYLDFYGFSRTIRTVGFHQALLAAEQGSAGARWLRDNFAGRAVFVGYSADHPAGQDRIRDDYATVFTRTDGLNLSGVEIAATAFGNLIEGRHPRPLPMTAHVGLVTAWAICLGLTVACLRMRLFLVCNLILIASYVLLAHRSFSQDGYWLPLVTPLLIQWPVAILSGAGWWYANERQRRRRLGVIVDDLLPASVVATVVDPKRTGIQLEQPIFGIFLMTDIIGFTSAAEAMTSDAAARALNQYFALTIPPIEQHGGQVSQIDGDGMLAFWLDHGFDGKARRSACLAAIEIFRLTSGGASGASSAAFPTRIGVHGGMVTLSRVGASRHHEYRIVGDAANTASRIEALSKHLGTRLLVSAEVLNGLQGLLTRSVGTFCLAGKVASVSVSELLAQDVDATDEQQWLCEVFSQMLEFMKTQQWREVTRTCDVILMRCPQDGPTRFYRALALRCAQSQSPEWDGMIRMGTK